MREVVHRNEYGFPRIFDINHLQNAKEALVAQMFTDAVFNQDIRVIQTIIQRIDGGLPKDTDVDVFQTLFGDCMNQVLSTTDGSQLRVSPDDTVMMALCKALYDLSITDIYTKVDEKTGMPKKVKPTTEAKQAKDSALRLVLERAGGRKSATPATPPTHAAVGVADWVQRAIGPQEEPDVVRDET